MQKNISGQGIVDRIINISIRNIILNCCRDLGSAAAIDRLIINIIENNIIII